MFHLERFTAADYELYCSLVFDKAVMQMNYGRVFTDGEAKYLFNAILTANEGYNRLCGYFKVFLKQTNEYIGMLGIAEDGDNSFELEYMLKEPYWGKGYATALVREQVGIIRNSYPKSCITAMTDVQNIASIKVLTKNGFSLTKSLINDKGNEVYCFCLEG